MDINIGYATIPAIHMQDAVGRTKQGWALPGGVQTTDPDQARRAAEIIDRTIAAVYGPRRTEET